MYVRPTRLPAAVLLSAALLAPASTTAHAAPAAGGRTDTTPVRPVRHGTGSLAGLRARLARPDAAHRPGVFWWWPGAQVDAKELATEIRSLHAAGFGSAQVTDLEPGPLGNGTTKWQWGTKAWFGAVASALRTATEVGVRLDIPPYPVWPMSSPVATLENGLSAQAAHVAQRSVTGPRTFRGAVPKPLGQLGLQTFQAVGAAKVVGHRAAGTELDPGSAIDLTGHVIDGRLTWKVPSGTWEVYAVWRRPTGQTPQTVPGGAVTSLDPIVDALVPGGLLAIDPFSHKATAAALSWLDAHMTQGVLERLLRRNHGQLYEDSFEYAANPADSVLLGLVEQFVENGFAIPRDKLDFVPDHRLGIMWTPAFLKRFRELRGYSIKPYLAALFDGTGGLDFTGGIGRRVRDDYQKTLTDLIVAHQRQLRAWARRHGFADLRHQTYGLPIDSGYANGAVGGVPDTESLEAGDPQPPGSARGEAALDMYRVAAGAAHVYGGKEVNIEAGDVFGLPDCAHLADPSHRRFCLYGEQPSDYWEIFNHGFAGGATHIQLHGLSYLTAPPGLAGAGWLGLQAHPWPGWSAMWYFFSESWNRTWPQWPFWREFTTYLGRAGTILTTGRPRMDVAYYRDDTLGFGIPVLAADARRKRLVRAGYTFEFVDPRTLVDRGTAHDGRLFPDGPGYRALVIDPADIATGGVPATAAARILALARRGLPIVVVGPLPRSGTSAAHPVREDRRVRSAFSALSRLPNVVRVGTSADVRGGLARLHVRPDFGLSKAALVRPVHRATRSADYWYLWNEGTRTVRFDARVRARGAPYLGNLWDNTFTPVELYRRGRHALRIPLTLTPGAATVLVVEHRRGNDRVHATATGADAVVATSKGLSVEDHSAGRFTVRLSTGAVRHVDLPAPGRPRDLTRWHLSVREFKPGGPSTETLDLVGLKDWLAIPALRNVSGTGTYTTRFSVPDSWRSGHRGVELDLGRIAGAVRVRLNGKRVTHSTVILPDQRFRLDDLLRSGTNTLTVTLATPPRNAMVGQARSGDPRYAYFLISPPQSNGLIGPVRLVPLSRAHVPHSG